MGSSRPTSLTEYVNIHNVTIEEHFVTLVFNCHAHNWETYSSKCCGLCYLIQNYIKL
jgi:hypothetical protein